ncbi:golgin subfamily A member 1 isoform X1 [Clupea harengus]|uniref:Golgin subfamily A member 1 n=2 Tax=Clupea harengus TaxID=7950 RepID=A0A6P3VNE5_CLUHA|nr:golgin subfamily A member 1 isoform X1 [Clupea harengus]
MFAKLKKKIAEEAATAPRSGGRMPRSMSKESITSVGADSGDDFASDGSSSRDDLPSQILRKNDHIRKLEAKLADYAEQLRLLQKTKEKLEIALETHQDSSMRKLQDQNESYQTNRAKMAEGMALALEKKDQEWMEKMAVLDQEKATLSARLAEMTEQSLSLFQKRDDLDELEGFQQQELAKVKHMLLKREEQLGQQERNLEQKEGELQTATQALAEAQGRLHELEQEHTESGRLNTELKAEREELLLVREEMELKVSQLETKEQQLQQLIQQVSEDFQQSQQTTLSLEKSLADLQKEHEELKLQQEQHRQKTLVEEEERERVLGNLQEKASSLQRRLESDLSQDEHLQELLKEKSLLEQRVEEARGELLQERTSRSSTVSSQEAQISRLNSNVTELQTLLRHKDDSNKAYRERTDEQIGALEQQVENFSQKLRSAELLLAESEAHTQTLQADWSEERERLQQQVATQRQRGLERCARLEEQLAALRTQTDTEHATAQEAKRELEEQKAELQRRHEEVESSLHTRTQELEQARADMSSRQTVNVEIAKALEDTRKQKEELQLQVGELTASQQTLQQEVSQLSGQLAAKEAEIQDLKEALNAAHAETEQMRAQAAERDQEHEAQLAAFRQEVISQTEQLDSCQSRVSDLQGELESMSVQLQGPEVGEGEQNGTVTVDDLDQLQKINKDLEQQLGDKNKTIKQLQQRLAELKRTLQKELKLKPDTETDGKEKVLEGRDRLERQMDRPSTEASGSAMAPTLAPGPSYASGSSGTTVINSSDLTDSREINFEYLKHVVLKFMSCREAEAFHLIRAVSVLLHFSPEEEAMLKQTLEYKMSWFGSKPSPKGTIRPSISASSNSASIMSASPNHWS